MSRTVSELYADLKKAQDTHDAMEVALDLARKHTLLQAAEKEMKKRTHELRIALGTAQCLYLVRSRKIIFVERNGTLRELDATEVDS